jgi:uncharacterized protein (DUF924 family)
MTGTILIGYGSNLWSKEITGAVAFALVLQRNAQNVWKGSDAGKDTDARARFSMGQHCHGGRSRPERLVSLRYIQLGKVRTAARIGCLF